MAKNQTYKAFSVRPSYIMDLNGELLDSASVLSQLAAEVRGISAYATYTVRNDVKLAADLAQVTVSQPAVAGRRAGVAIPSELVVKGELRKNKAGKLVEEKVVGKSRKEWLFRHRVVTEHRSWQERVKAANGEDAVNLGAVDKQYAVIENNPLKDGKIVLKMVIRGQWYRLIFPFDNARFAKGKIALPVIKVENNQPVFIFTVATDNPIIQFSGDYTIGVDVGINDYATVVVRDSKTGQIVRETTLSQRVHSLWNSVRASERQVRALNKKADKVLYDRQAHMCAIDEAQFHREAASRKKRELAILAAQEIAALSYSYGNAVVAVEDLSWISNTMQNGRWNRGAFVQWLTHYVSQNGGWVVSVNSASTSQLCHACGSKVVHPEHEVSVCPKHGALDRDVNAAANIAARAVARVEKARKTRAKNRKLQRQAQLKTPVARETLKYPGRDRTKNAPTPKRKNRTSKGVNLPISPARVNMTTVLADCGTYGAVETDMAAINQENIAYECRLCNLN